MTPASFPVRARLDGAGHFIDADPALVDLQIRAGGAVPGPICIPQIEAITRLALRVRAPVRRALLAADGDEDLKLDVEARPSDNGVELVIGAWTRQAAYAPAVRPAAFTGKKSGGLFEWETDATLRLTRVKPPVAGSELGEMMTASIRLIEDEAGNLPLLAALALREGFFDQAAEMRADGSRYMLEGAPVFEGGVFRGFRGVARRLGCDDGQAPAIIPESLEYALREPLDTILADAERIAEEAEGPLEKRHVGYARDILTAGRHLKALIDDAMHLQAIERPDFTLSLRPIDLAEIARDAAAMVAVQADEAEVTIVPPATGMACPALGERRRVLEIAINLVCNAIRYAPRGSGVVIHVETRHGEAALIVRDQGIGIDPSEHQRIFEKYQRVDPSEPGGSGLGLYIARRVARAMGGNVDVKSSPGDGAAFILTLPRG